MIRVYRVVMSDSFLTGRLYSVGILHKTVIQETQLPGVEQAMKNWEGEKFREQLNDISQ